MSNNLHEKPCAVCGAPSDHLDMAHLDDCQALGLSPERVYPLCNKHDWDKPAQSTFLKVRSK